MAGIRPEDRTVPRLVELAAEQYGERIALKQDGVEISYQQLNDLRIQVAKAFIYAGIVKGDRVAVVAPNHIEWVLATIGMQSIGAVLVPVNTRWKGSEIADVLNRSGSKMLFTVPHFQASPKSAINYLELLADEALNTVEQVVCLNGEASGSPLANTIDWQTFLAGAEQVSEADYQTASDQIGVDDVMDMLFTSGTTGKPKGVLCAHGQNIRVVETWADTVGLRSDDNYLIINPFFHSFGYKAGWLAALTKGARILPVLSFDLDSVLQMISDEQVSMLPGPPTIYQSILVHPKLDQYDISSLRLAVTGAAAVPVELVKKMRSELNFETVVTAYGLTESCGFVAICRADDDPETIANTSGRAMADVELKCVDGEGNEVPNGEPGEIWVRGYNVMLGYFENPEATAETITDDGWLKTGDVGVMDERGYIKITDRIKDMYISGGFNIYPAELENNLSSLDGVAQVAVIGIPDERMGEVGKAFIVKAPGADITEESVMAWCKQNMANYKVPRVIQFLDAMPLNAAGKIMKPVLRADS